MAAEMYVTGMDRIDWRGICTCLELRELALSRRKDSAWQVLAAAETHGQHRQRWS